MIRETRPLSAVNESIDDVLHGRIPGRIVFDLAGTSGNTAARFAEEAGSAR